MYKRISRRSWPHERESKSSHGVKRIVSQRVYKNQVVYSIRMKRKTPRQKLMDEADDLTRQLVRGRGSCEAAGKDSVRCGGGLQWCHIVGRGNKRLRHELWNALCMCQGHHVYYTHHPEAWWLDFIPNHFPSNYELILKHRNEVWDKDLSGTIERLKATPPPDRDMDF